MAILSFPPINLADEHGLLAMGGDLDISSLKLAYKSGIFPWPISEAYPLAWFSPDPRGILECSDLYLSSSLKKFLKKNPFEIKVNQNFEAVIMNCAKVKRPEQEETWITEDIYRAYINLFYQQYAYSVETYLEGQLVGGVYGVCIDGIVSGESMFYREPNASKTALIYLIKTLELAGIGWLDTQMVTPVVKSLGGKTIPRDNFIKKIKNCQNLTRDEIFSHAPSSLL